eukprot:10975075-Ditylum_brightwellii.AAC.1
MQEGKATPNIDDKKKLRRMLRHLQATKDLPLTLKADDLGQLTWWVDAAFAVHHDMQSHTGGVLMAGKGAIYTTSIKQKLDTCSLTEAELIRVNNVLLQVLWTRYFLEGQDIEVRDNIVYQDNQSAMRLEKNRKGSIGKRTSHINIRYFFVTDRIASGELTV